MNVSARKSHPITNENHVNPIEADTPVAANPTTKPPSTRVVVLVFEVADHHSDFEQVGPVVAVDAL